MLTVKSWMTVGAVLLIGAGCATLGGRTAGQWVDDKATIAKVKAALASTRIETLTRLNVDTFKGTVYLTGVVPNESVRRQLTYAAQVAAEGHPVVSNLAVADHILDRSEATATSRATPMALTGLKFSRLDAEPSIPGRFAAYDEAGERVATVYTLLAWDLEQDGVADLDTGERQVHRISIYPKPGSDEYHVVLWHTAGEAAALR